MCLFSLNFAPPFLSFTDTEIKGGRNLNFEKAVIFFALLKTVLLVIQIMSHRR